MTPDVDEETKKAIGRRLKAVRKAVGWTGISAAKIFGVTSSAWYQYENGARTFHLNHAIELNRLTKVPLDYLYLGDESGLPLHLAMKLIPPDRFFRVRGGGSTITEQ